MVPYHNLIHPGISDRMLHTHENLAVLEDVRLKYESSAVIIAHIYKKCYDSLEGKSCIAIPGITKSRRCMP